MTITLAVDVNNDLFIGTDGALALASGLAAALQDCKQAAQAQLGEMIYATDKGIPNFAVVWSGSPNKSLFEAYLRRNLLGVVDVLEVVSLVSSVANNVLSYTATIRTIYGTGILNG